MTASGIWAIFTAFRPGLRLVEAIESVQAQVDGVIVVDDGGGGDDDVWEKISALNVTVRRSTRNEGIAAALNRGVSIATDAGARAVVTFDQDSTVDRGFVERLATVLEQAGADGGRVGAVVPEFFAQVRQARGQNTEGWALAADPIQSGMLIPLSSFHRVGGFREDFFIDRVDTEFAFRLRARGYFIAAAAGVRLEHALGAQYVRRRHVPGLPDVMTLSTPFRYFYRVRNRVVLNRMYVWRFPIEVARDTLFDVAHFLDALMVARPRRTMSRIYRLAIVAARRGRMGRIPDALAEEAAGVRWGVPAAQSMEPTA